MIILLRISLLFSSKAVCTIFDILPLDLSLFSWVFRKSSKLFSASKSISACFPGKKESVKKYLYIYLFYGCVFCWFLCWKIISWKLLLSCSFITFFILQIIIVNFKLTRDRTMRLVDNY